MRIVARKELYSMLGATDSVWCVGAFDNLVSDGVEYRAGGFCVFQGKSFYYILDNRGKGSWLPSMIFDLIDTRVNGDWIVGIFAGEPSLVCGVSEIAESKEAYEESVAGDQTRAIQALVRELSARTP